MPKHLPALAILAKKPAIAYCMALILLFLESSHHAVKQLRYLHSSSSFGVDAPAIARQNRELNEIASLPIIVDAHDQDAASSDEKGDDDDADGAFVDSGEDDDEISSDEEYIASLPQDIVHFHASDTPPCFAQVIVRIWPRASVVQPPNVACQGLLLRDDLVVTTSYCAATATSVQIPVIQTNKTVALLATADDDRPHQRHPLGLLKVDLPSSHRNSGIPRKRMFLGGRSVAGSNNRPLHCRNNRPIATALPTVNSAWISIAPLRKFVSARDILWDDDIIDTAAELTNGRRKWWVARQSKAVLEQVIIDLGKKWRAPPGSGGVDIDNAANIGALLEAEDPRGHRFHMCFSLYHRRWMEQEPFSGVPFYDWLDFGSGKNITPVDYEAHPELRNRGWGIDCPKEKFNDRKLHYLNQEERKQYAVDLTPFKNGELVRVTYQKSGAPIDDDTEVYLFVLSIDGMLYVIPDAHQSIGHSTLIASEPALAAGELLIGKKGRLEDVEFSSGHYRGRVSSFVAMYNWMIDLGLNTSSVDFELRGGWNVTAKSKRDALKSGKKVVFLENNGGGEVLLMEK